MKQLMVIITFMSALIVVLGQRAPFAGKRPNGYKDRLQADSADQSGIADRFGENTSVSGTTERLPNLALGDREIVDRLNEYPVDQRPFWLINAEAIEAQKNQGRPTLNTNQNSGSIVNRFGSGTGTGTGTSTGTSYPSVVYPIQMTAEQRQQAQQMFHNQIQQITSNQQSTVSNPLPSRIGVQQPVVTTQTLNGSPKQISLPVQGRPISSGYNG